MVWPHLYEHFSNRIIAVNRDKFSVGRSLRNDHVINNRYISRVQFTLERTDGVWKLQDQSTNGTLLNEQRIMKGEVKEIKTGDMIKFINLPISLEFRIPEDADSDDDCIVIDCSDCSEGFNQRKRNLTPRSDQSNENVAPKRSKQQPDAKANETPESALDKNSNPEKKAGETVGSAPKDDEQSKENETAKVDPAKSEDEEELHCSICSELFIKAVTLNCSHTFCRYCISHWKLIQKDCPICRKIITCMAATLVLDNYIEKLVERMDEEERKQREEIVKLHTTLAAQDANVVQAPLVNPETAGPSTSNSIPIVMIHSSTLELSSATESDDDDDDFEVLSDSESVTGIPGTYYGGYGRCYKCFRRGHWANGCPFM